MKTSVFRCLILLTFCSSSMVMAQERDGVTITGLLHSDDRILTNDNHEWVWNEQRLTLYLDQKYDQKYKFHSEIWLRNFGIPAVTKSHQLYNKGITDPVSAEIREVYVQLNGFILKNLDITIGRQRLAWGTADRLNPTDNLNPADMEDILDFGRRRGSDAIHLIYYPSTDLSLQAVYLPRFSPATLPAGVFANILSPRFELPFGWMAKQITDTLLTPASNLAEGATIGFRAKGFIAGVDCSVSYVWGRDGLPRVTGSTLSPLDNLGDVSVHAELSWPRYHILGIDMATSLGGAGLWAEAALHIPDQDVMMFTDLSPMFPWSPVPVILDSVLIRKTDPFFKYIVGGDYHFSDGSYLNLQFQHGFLHENGREELNDYLFIRYEKSFFGEKLKLAPLTGALVATTWDDIKNGYAIVYMPEINYQANQNTEISMAAAFFRGKGDNIFASLENYNMVILKLKYHF